MTFDPQRAQTLFLAALELSDSAARRDFLDRECANDTSLRQRVEALLDADGATQGFGVEPSARAFAATIESKAAVRPGTFLAGRYKLLEAIGEGGMGTVWMAEQKEPVKRKVAIKLVKAGMDSAQVLTRFEAERQALALMDHPNIAKVFDGGMTDQGRPFFVMEFVKGVPLTEYCDRARLSLKERLQLFIPVCQAVQHAHQKGIIHRDLKPSNILICLYDGKPVPKVIDFGLAKALHQSLTEQTVQTALGMMVGTPLYMSPEQAEHNNLDVDTRTDIYSLGVILYELLTGSTPLERQQLKEAAFNEILRLIKEVEPPKPSTRLSGSAGLPSIAAQRSIDPSQLRKSLAGDLDWIVMKALDKERSRRYGTANGLARDIDRFLNDEAVEACPPSSGYKLRKFIKRHRVQVVTASAVLVAILLGLAGTIWGIFEARQQREAALASAANEKAANEKSQERLRQVEKGYEIIAGIFADVDIRAIKQDDQPLEAVLAERLVTAAEQLEGDSVGDPLLVADLQNRLGESLLGLGFPSRANALFEKSLETRTRLLPATHPDTIASMNNLGLGYQEAGQAELAVPLLEKTLEIAHNTLGPADSKTLIIMNNLALAFDAIDNRDKALPLYENVLRIRSSTLGKDDADTLTSMNNLAEAYRAAGKPALAVPLLEETLRLVEPKVGEEHRSRLTIINNLALAYNDIGNWELARPLFEETLRIRKSKFGNKHPDTITSMNNLGQAYTDHGQFAQAVPLLEEALGLLKQNVGYENPVTVTVMNNLAMAYDATGQRDRALPLYEDALRIRRRDLGNDHADTILSMNNLGISLRELGRLDEAVLLMEEAYRRGTNHPGRKIIGNGLLNTYVIAGRVAEITPLAKELLAAARKELPAESPQLAGLMATFGLFLIQVESYSEAELVLSEALTIREKTQPDEWTTYNTKSLLGGALLGQKKYVESEPLLLSGYEGMKERESSIPPQGNQRLIQALDRLIALYTEWHVAEPNQGYDAKAAEWRKKRMKDEE